MKGLFRNKIYIVLLLVISFISHWYIFFDFGVLNAGDWIYIPQTLLKNLIHYGLWNPHVNLGEVISMPNNMLFYWFASILMNIFTFFSWDIFTRIFFLIPIVFLTPIFSFLLFKKIFSNDLIAFFSTCIYSFNTFFLKLQLDHITYAFIWWVLPALFLSILNYLEIKKNKYLIYNSLLVFIGIVYEVRIMIIVLVFLSLFQIVYLIFNNDSLKKKIKINIYVFLSYVIGILMHSFWLVPFIRGLGSDVLAQASPQPFISLYDILDAFTLHMYSWSRNLVLESFIKQPIDLWYFLIPIIAMIGIVSFKKKYKNNNRNIYFIFFSLALMVFIFLAKQEFPPYGELYTWAFYNIPLFNLFRESSKFFILVAFSISFFFGLGLFYIYKLFREVDRKRKGIFIVIIILFFSSIFNLQNFVSQRIGGMVKGVEIPEDYKVIEEYLSQDSNYYRTLWIPRSSRWSYYSYNHPKMDLISVIENTLNNLLDFKKIYGNHLISKEEMICVLMQDYSENLLDLTSVRYIIIPLDSPESNDSFFRYYGSRDFFIGKVSELPYLRRIDLGTDELLIFENKDYRPHIYITLEKEKIYKDIQIQNIYFYSKNTREYKIFLENIDKKMYLNFSEAFHKEWKFKIGEFNWFKALTAKNYFLADKFHFKNDVGLNSFVIDPGYIKANFSREYYYENKDGSINIELSLYFYPQSYFYLGLIISGFFLLGSLGYLVYVLYYCLRKRRSKISTTDKKIRKKMEL